MESKRQPPPVPPARRSMLNYNNLNLSIPPPFPASQSLRPVSPRITLNSSSEDLLGADRAQYTGPIRNLTPNSTAPSSPTVHNGHDQPVYNNTGDYRSSAETLLPPRRGFASNKTNSFDSNFIPEYYVRDQSRDSSDTFDYPSAPKDPFSTPLPSPGWDFDSHDGLRPITRDDDDTSSIHVIGEKFNIFADENLLMYPKDVEPDDELHAPDGKKVDRDFNFWTKRGFVNLGGLLVMVGGLLFLFIGYPVIFFVQNYFMESHPEEAPACSGFSCLRPELQNQPLLKNVRQGLIDPDTPQSAKTRKATDGKNWKLVFSDEFNEDGRTFYPGEDPYWEAVDIWYGATLDSEWYDPNQVTTKNGVLEITFDAWKTHDLSYRSGMLQSWNKLCFTGGIVEASVSLPGRGDIIGFWPGFWTMGNLGRPGYLASTEGMWPYSYHDKCDVGITANQSSHDGISFLPGMRLPGCTCKGEDHPTPGKARSSPEIDVFEALVHTIDKKGTQVGAISQSVQMAPFDVWYQPDYDFVAVYNNSITTMNEYRGGNLQQAFSGLTTLNNEWYDGKKYQTYAYEYKPGADGYIEWDVGREPSWRMEGPSIGPNGNIGQRVVPMEPMTIILNLGMGTSFQLPNYPEISKLLPAKMRVDWVRIYQPEGAESITCDPPGYETTQYIQDHLVAYTNPNLTTWESTNFTRPKNSFENKC
ncbi:hypothetical protein Dda_4506 [Drechslerella dactyloides]|uniref:GH16 domain-containing protein n=1 Tax=Drechslerella dactyloides TaxID=74499 RepID=A0AAD6J192_DREDA|nr:hypothetical protein Dda_4506 [Drechslerella dactyloides]